MFNRHKQAAIKIVKTLTKAGHIAYFAGGCVRDLLMRKKPLDYDIATSATADTVEKLFSKTVAVGKSFGVMVVLIDDFRFEVASFRQEGEYRDGRWPTYVKPATPQEDAQRRDFTINGLFYDPLKKKLIDYVDGRRDIKNKIIRTIGSAEDRFGEDKLRLIRAIRFATNLGFKIEKNTWEAIKRRASEIKSVSKERIRDELIKMLTRMNAGHGLELLAESSLLKEILPEVDKMRGVMQPKEFHPEGDVFIHTKIMLDKLREPSVILAFAALLHDVGKPATFQMTDRIHFYEHSRVGAELARAILERLRFSNKEIDDIVAATENHMRFIHVKEMREGKLKRLLASRTFLEELELHKLDCLASHGNLDNWKFLKKKFKQYKTEELKPKPLVNGHDLLALGFKAGPQLGEILKNIYELQLEGKLRSKEEALQWIKNTYKVT